MAPTWVIPLGAFQYAMVGEVGFCLNRRLGPLLPTPFQAPMGPDSLPDPPAFWQDPLPGLFYAPLRLAPRLCA